MTDELAVTAPSATDDDAVDDDVSAGVLSDGAYSLFIADFDDTDSAWATYEDLKAAADGVTVKIEGVVVVKREVDGKVQVQKATDHSTKKGLTWGVVGGAVIGLIFPPASERITIPAAMSWYFSPNSTNASAIPAATRLM